MFEIKQIPITSISACKTRSSPIDLAEVRRLQKTISEWTLFHPICVSPRIDGGYDLVLGRNRFEAFVRNHALAIGRPIDDWSNPGIANTDETTFALNIVKDRYDFWSQIPAVVLPKGLEENEKLEARLLENFVRADLDQLEQADILWTMKLQYEEKYPFTKVGMTGGGRNGKGTIHKTDIAPGAESVLSFVEYISSLLRMRPRKIYELLILHHLRRQDRDLFKCKKITYKTAMKFAVKSYRDHKGKAPVLRTQLPPENLLGDLPAEHRDAMSKHRSGVMFKNAGVRHFTDVEMELMASEIIGLSVGLEEKLKSIFYKQGLSKCQGTTCAEFKYTLIHLVCWIERIWGENSFNHRYQMECLAAKKENPKFEFKII